jgi:hypothetical protein
MYDLIVTLGVCPFLSYVGLLMFVPVYVMIKHMNISIYAFLNNLGILHKKDFRSIEVQVHENMERRVKPYLLAFQE